MDPKQKRKYKKHKQGYSVSIHHVLRKDKNFLERLLSKTEPGAIPKFPIYIRVAFMQQTATIRSRLPQLLTEDEFAEYIERLDIQTLIGYESAAIRQSIEEFAPDTRENFVMSQWTEEYNKLNIPIQEFVSDWLTKEFYTLVCKEYQNNLVGSEIMNDTVDGAIRYITSLFASIDILARTNYPAAKTLTEQYSSLFHGPYIEQVTTTEKIFTLWDWKMGFYEEILKAKHGTDINQYFYQLLSISQAADIQKIKNYS